MNLPPVIYQGSVKTLRGHPQDDTLLFEFSNSYSVFDWGKMPDQLADKGRALAYMSALIFEHLGSPVTWSNWQWPKALPVDTAISNALEELRRDGLGHHFVQYSENTIQVRRVRVLKPQWNGERWDYGIYHTPPPGSCLIPLEVIFRHGVPEGSSLPQRIQRNPSYGEQIGLNVSNLQTGERFAGPVIEFSTKLESSDRFLSYQEAREISHMSQLEFSPGSRHWHCCWPCNSKRFLAPLAWSCGTVNWNLPGPIMIFPASCAWWIASAQMNSGSSPMGTFTFLRNACGNFISLPLGIKT